MTSRPFGTSPRFLSGRKVRLVRRIVEILLVQRNEFVQLYTLFIVHFLEEVESPSVQLRLILLDLDDRSDSASELYLEGCRKKLFERDSEFRSSSA